MVYVDLNPIRARMAASPEQSDHTSIKQRIEQALKTKQPYLPEQQPDSLFPFAGYPRENSKRPANHRIDPIYPNLTF